MTQEEKILLLKDLCARLPYKPRVRYYYHSIGSTAINGYSDEGYLSYQKLEDFSLYPKYGLEKTRVYNVSPYLRPMSSMTEEELNECVCRSGIKDIECPNWQDIPKEKQFEARLKHAIAVFLTDSNNVDWLNAHHFDYRDLIKKGLATEAPEGMYNN